MSELERYRRQLDEVDAQLLALFERRMQLARQIGAHKAERGMQVYDAARERQVLESRLKGLSDGTLAVSAEAYVRTLMKLAKDEQRRITGPQTVPARAGGSAVAYQGIPGAYGEEAAMACFPDGELVGCETFERVFERVANGEARYGVLPIENTTAGAVHAVYDLLGRYGCVIVGEHALKVEHCLLTRREVNVLDIADVYSHEQALRQCARYLQPYECHVMSNTAVAARFVAQSQREDIAAVASRRAAEEYGLHIAAADICTESGNYTRFVVIAAQGEPIEGRGKVFMVFTTRHEPGKLYAALGVFADYALNVTRLESRNIPESPWDYRFYLDFEGELDERTMQKIMARLEEHTSECRVLGWHRYE